MKDDQAAKLTAAVAELRAEYLPTVPAKLATLEALVRQARSNGDDDSRERLRALAHRLRGTMGSYGFAEIGAAVGRIEDALAPPRSGERAPDMWDEIEHALQAALHVARDVGDAG